MNRMLAIAVALAIAIAVMSQSSQAAAPSYRLISNITDTTKMVPIAPGSYSRIVVRASVEDDGDGGAFTYQIMSCSPTSTPTDTSTCTSLSPAVGRTLTVGGTEEGVELLTETTIQMGIWVSSNTAIANFTVESLR